MIVEVIFRRRACKKGVRLLKKIEKNVSDTVSFGEEIIKKHDEMNAEIEQRVADTERRLDNVERKIDLIPSVSTEKTGARNDEIGRKTDENEAEVST